MGRSRCTHSWVATWMNKSGEPVNPALARLQASVRIGGKGTVRRKKKVVHKTTTTDDKRLQNTLKRLGINSIPAIEEVNLFMESGEVIHFTNPKVQAQVQIDETRTACANDERKFQKIDEALNEEHTENMVRLMNELREIEDKKFAVETEGKQLELDHIAAKNEIDLRCQEVEAGIK